MNRPEKQGTNRTARLLDGEAAGEEAVRLVGAGEAYIASQVSATVLEMDTGFMLLQRRERQDTKDREESPE